MLFHGSVDSEGVHGTMVVVTWPMGISVSFPLAELHMCKTRAVSLRPLGACCLSNKGLL